MDNVIIFLFFLCIFSLAAFVVNIANRLEKIEKENNTNNLKEIHKIKVAIDDINIKLNSKNFEIQSLTDKVNNYKPYNDEERAEICKALEQDMINVLKNVNNFIENKK